jgi:CheY-like chemotaxis protein
MAKKILIVEDDAVISTMYATKLRMSGFEVTEVENGADAVMYLDGNVPDAILMDMMMPVMNGFDAISMIRSYIPGAKAAKIIVFSNLDGDEHQKRAFKLGADGYMVKAETTPAKVVAFLGELLGDGETLG